MAKLKKDEVVKFWNDMFHFNLWFMKCRQEDMINNIKKEFDYDIKYHKHKAGSFIWFEKKRTLIILIWIKPGNMTSLPHESIHASGEVLRRAGIDVATKSGEETLCYLSDWMCNQIKDFLKEYKKKKKGTKCYARNKGNN